jgi:hypothetical protein
MSLFVTATRDYAATNRDTSNNKQRYCQNATYPRIRKINRDRNQYEQPKRDKTNSEKYVSHLSLRMEAGKLAGST